MGRPKTHDQHVATSLVDAAEQLADAGGVSALSVRAVAERSGTTTRAVYSVFGSKAGLVAALGTRMFVLLGEGVAALPETDDPAADLVQAGVGVFRQLSVTRPALFEIGVRHSSVAPAIIGEFGPAARDAWGSLEARFQRLQSAGRLPGRSVAVAARQFDAMCEGLAAMERRGSMTTDVTNDDPETQWRAALGTLLVGMAEAPG